MDKKCTRALASTAIISLVLTSTLEASPVHAAAGRITRTSGADRYATAAQVARANWSYGAKDVILVSGEGYADAVSASSLAKQLDAPILLTNSKVLNDDTKAALDALNPKNIYIVGGNASVSQTVRNSLRNYGYNLIELQGANRYETNVAVARKLVELGVSADKALLVGGEGFSDALSAAPVAAAKGQILLLGTNDTKSMKPVIDFVKANNSQITVIGTSNIISNYMYDLLGAVARVDGGANRFETNINILRQFDSELKADKLFIANASGDGYADALVASALAGKTASPLVLVDNYGSGTTNNAINYITTKSTKTTDLNVVGGTGVVSESMVYDINTAIDRKYPTKPGNNSATVQSIEPVSLNQMKIHFNTAVDEDSAEDVSNYKIDGTQLSRLDDSVAKDENGACASKIDDNTILITFAKPRKQYDDVTVTVKRGILTEDKNDTINGFEETVTFSDLKPPSLKRVSVEGNSQLTVEFSEAVNMKTINELKSRFKIDGQSIGNYGVNTQYSEIKDCVKINNSSYGPTGTWANKVMFYLDSSIESGNHTLTISDGDSNNGLLCDAGGFTFREKSEDFQVDNMTTRPRVKSIKEVSSGKVYITFDRPMDIQTAKDLSNYEINNKRLDKIDGAYIETDNDDTVVKLKHISDGTIESGSNRLYISNKVKDAFGNKVEDDTRVNFNHVKDETKPKVDSITVVDSETIRVRFSKDVDYSYATNTSNYKLKDNKGIDITNHIRGIYSTSGESDRGNTDTFNIKLYKYDPDNSSYDWRLTGSKYTLTIKNIIDTSSTPNTMDDYAYTINGNDDVAPRGVGIYAKLRGDSDSNRDKVIVYFSEPMDTATITDKSNFKFINGEGDTRSLPSGTNISVGGDDKSAIIEFPSNYHVKTTGKTTSGSTNDVTAVSVFNVKDQSGNILDGVAYNNDNRIDKAKSGAKVKDKTLRVYYDGDDLKADVQFDKAIEYITPSDFTLGGIKPSTANIHGDKVTLIFKEGAKASEDEKKDNPLTYANGRVNNNPTKIELVKAQGQGARLKVVSTGTIDETGARVSRDENDKVIDLSYNQSVVYNYEAAPRTTCSSDSTPDYWTATRDINGGKVYITFDTILDPNSGVRTDDFNFSGNNGTDIKPDSIRIDGTTVIFSFDSDNKNYKAFNSSTLDIRVRNTVSLRTVKDADGNNANYQPSSYDLRKRTVTISASSVKTLEGVALTDALGIDNNGKTQFSLSGVTKANASDTFKYIISTTGNAIPKPNEGDNLSSWIDVVDGDKVTVANGTHIGIAEVDVNGRAVKFTDAIAVVKDYVAATAGKVIATNGADLTTVMESKTGSLVIKVDGTDVAHTFTLPLDSHAAFLDVNALATTIGTATNDSSIALNTVANVAVVDGKIIITSKSIGTASTVSVTAIGADSADILKLTGFIGNETGTGTPETN